MKEYKIGDTVWTRKRGKCTVIHIYHTGILSTPDRPYLIISDSQLLYNPKASNLYPSEAAMNCAKGCQEYGSAKFLEGLQNVTVTINVPDFIKPEPIQPKFKAGDAVYYNGNKWHIVECDEFRGEIGYKVDNGTIFGWLFEREIRLWKETVLTHCLQLGGNWTEITNDSFYKSAKFIGNIIGHDTFLWENNQGNKFLFRGIKGDDI